MSEKSYECGKLLAIWASKRKKKKNQHRAPLKQPCPLKTSVLVNKASRTPRGKGWDVRASFSLGWGGEQSVIQSTTLQYIHAHLHPEGGIVFITPIVETYDQLKKTQGTNST